MKNITYQSQKKIIEFYKKYKGTPLGGAPFFISF